MTVAVERLTLGHGHIVTEEEHLARYRFAMQLVEGKEVADIACGTGYGTQLLGAAGARSVHGMDLSAEAVAACAERYGSPRVMFSVANAEDLADVADGAFEVVVSFETIEHLPHVEAYLDEMARILKPGGTYLVSTPDRRLSSVMYLFRRRPTNQFHVREYTRRELLDLLSTRFQIKGCYGQRFVPGLFVLWPVQVLLRTISRLPGMSRVRAFKDKLYSHGADAEVTPQPSGDQVAKFWVVACVRPER
jgi:2-polyprenyl-3-methyl-5-hydroxy-6-metoxy-1,4-benzoquinol methylase